MAAAATLSRCATHSRLRHVPLQPNQLLALLDAGTQNKTNAKRLHAICESELQPAGDAARPAVPEGDVCCAGAD